jgi:tetratricopeptide (TPR) repeat protein
MAKKSRKIKAPDRKDSIRVPAERAITQPPTRLMERDWFQALTLILFVILAYQPMWRAGFMWDDNLIVTSNPCVVGPIGLKEIWTTSAARFYPLVLSTFWLEHALWGLRPVPFHLVNILMHATSAVALWRVLRSLDFKGSWLGAAFWALHPVQVETVAWISEMKNTESCLFYLLTILFYIKGLKAGPASQAAAGRWNFALSLLFAAAAMASKSSTLLMPVVLGLCTWWVKGRWRWRDMARIVPFLFMAIVAIAITVQIVQRYGGDEMKWARSWPERVALAGDVFWFYLGKLAWPHPLMTFYPGWEIDPGQLTSYLPAATLLLVLAVLWFNHRSWSRPYLFAFAYYLISLLPVMGLFGVTGFRYSLVEDHLQYLASMGPLALAGAGLTRLTDLAISTRRWAQPAFLGALLLVFGTLTWKMTWVFQDETSLWTYNLAQNPTCWLAYNGLGAGLANQGKLDEAMKLYRTSLEIKPNYAEPHSNLGEALAQKGEWDAAIAEYREAVTLNPNLARPFIKLGEALFRTGRVDEAISQYRSALGIDPYAALAYNDLGLALAQKGELADAIPQYEKAVSLDPHFAAAHNDLGVALFRGGQVDAAIVEYQKALQIDPANAQTRDNLGLALTEAGVALLRAGRMDEAIAQFQDALKSAPTLAQAHSDLGIALAQTGKLDAALAEFQEALRLKPSDEAARINLEKIKAMAGQSPPSR